MSYLHHFLIIVRNCHIQFFHEAILLLLFWKFSGNPQPESCYISDIRKQTRFSSQYLPITCTKQQGPVCSCTFFRKIFLCCNNVYYSGTAMGKSSRNCRFYCIFVRLVSSFFASFSDNNFIFSEEIFILRQRFTPPLNLTQFIFFKFYDWKIWNRFIKIQEWNHDFSPY